MRILIATNHSYMLYRFRRELIEALASKHEVILSMPFVGHQEDFQAMGLHCIDTPIDRRGINPLRDIKLFHAYRQMLRQIKPDAVITYSIKPNIYLGAACRFSHIPLHVNVQGLGTAFETPGLAQFVSALYHLALRSAQTVFFENTINADYFVLHRIISRQQAVVLPGAGINLKAYPLLPMERADVCRFLFVGRIMREKGVEEFFSAARTLKAEFGAAVSFEIVGFYEDAYKPVVEALVSDGIIVFHGFQTQMLPFYATSHCVVLPSYHEGMSNVLLEGAACGRPLITSDIPGCREAVQDGVSGYLCQAKDANSLTNAMRKLLQLPVDQRMQMGLAGRHLMEQQFDKQAVVAQTLSHITL